MDTPVAEDGMTGVAIGMALAGLRPIHTHIRMDFMLAVNQLFNIAKSRYMSGGAVQVPLTVRTVIGRSWGQGAQHSQGLHALYAHVPGLKVVAPSTPYDAKGCLISAIRDNNPVIFVEHRLAHLSKVLCRGNCTQCHLAKRACSRPDLTSPLWAFRIRWWNACGLQINWAALA